MQLTTDIDIDGGVVIASIKPKIPINLYTGLKYLDFVQYSAIPVYNLRLYTCFLQTIDFTGKNQPVYNFFGR